VWLIPLASGGTSVGIVADAALHPINTMNNFDRALAWLYKHEPQCARAIDAKQHLLQDFKALKHYSYDCKKVFSEDRWCLTGEAGAFADPFYSPGTDLIGISNGFVTDLITRDLKGEPIEPRVEAYNSLYRSFCRELLVFYEGQYPLMGNAQLMLTKITWDWSIYWGFATLLFFHNKLCDLEFMTRVSHVLQRANDLNACMQKFFRQWDERGRRPKSRKGFVPLTDIDFLYDLHEGLSAGLNDKELAVRLSENLAVVETAAAEIIRKAEQLVPGAAAEKLAYWSDNGSSGASQIPASEEIAADLDAIWLDAIPVPV